MIDIQTLKQHPEIAESLKLEVTASDLIKFGDELVRQAVEAGRSQETPEQYLTPEETAKILKVSLVTLWHWDKKEITRPVKIGNQKRYRRSDIDNLMTRQ